MKFYTRRQLNEEVERRVQEREMWLSIDRRVEELESRLWRLEDRVRCLERGEAGEAVTTCQPQE